MPSCPQMGLYLLNALFAKTLGGFSGNCPEIFMCPSSASFPFKVLYFPPQTVTPLSCSHSNGYFLFDRNISLFPNIYLIGQGEALRSHSLGACFVTIYKPICTLSSRLSEVSFPSLSRNLFTSFLILCPLPPQCFRN